MKLWNSSVKRIYDPRVSMKLKLLVDRMVKEWPFDEWEFQVNRDGAYRTLERQKELYAMKPRRTWTLKSKHLEGKALDFTLYKAGTEEAKWGRYAYCCLWGFVCRLAKEEGIDLRWGADWDEDGNLAESDNNEFDFVHVEV